MFEIKVNRRFSAAHHLRGYEGDCESVHGHNWDVEVTICGEQARNSGMLLDFRKAKAAIDKVLERLDHHDLNALPEFESTNPTSENVAYFIHGQLSAVLNADGVWVHRVSVGETPDCRACYSVQEPRD